MNSDGAVILRDQQEVDWDTVLTKEEQEEFIQLTNVLVGTIPYCPWTPSPKQTSFLLDFGREALYGGAVGGAKSVALMMAASQFLYVPGYAALLLRKSFTDLNRPGALMDMAQEWWGGMSGVHFDRQQHKYTFECPGGGRSLIEFGAMDNENDRFKYQGGRYHFVGYDELTQFKERDYRYLFSRQRRVKVGPLSRIPIRMRGATNPGGVGHEWVFKRFIARWQAWRAGKAPRPPRNFWPALLADNPHLDIEDYLEGLMELDPITRAQLLRGDWNIRPDGRMFKARWFKPITREQVPGNCRWVRYWDMASTEEMPATGVLADPDFTAGALVGRSPAGGYYIADIKHWRHEPAENDLLCGATGWLDTRRVNQVMEQEPGSSGKTAIHHYRTQVFDGLSFRGIPSTGSKVLRANPVASHADAGNVYVVVDGSWDTDGFLDEIEIFPDGGHDDRVDAVSGAMGVLAKLHRGDLVFDAANDGFTIENQWTPDAQKAFSVEDAQNGWVRQRMDQTRATDFSPDMIRSEVNRAWGM